MSEPETEDRRASASHTLGRLVRFMASALDLRYAFVLASQAEERARPRLHDVWLARDYGLRTDFAEVSTSALREEMVAAQLLEILRVAWPHEPDLVGPPDGKLTSLPLHDPKGGLIGHMGVLDPVRRLKSADYLRPLARVAAAELRRFREADEADRP
jgi:hypothetical protein